MKLKEVNPDKIAPKPRTKQSMVRDILNQFKESQMTCAEIEDWQDISETLEGVRCMVRNQISYRNGSLYKGIRVVTQARDDFKVYLVKDGGTQNGRD